MGNLRISAASDGLTKMHQLRHQMGEHDLIMLLARHERLGTLPEFLREHAPEYVSSSGDVYSFSLAVDLGLL